DSTILFKAIPTKNKNRDFQDWSDTEGIDKNGSLSRGMSFGNRQNVFVNSAMNLQLSGMITEDIELNALITDSQVPYQPEGNTQQIQDFDRILIELKHEKWNLQAGDVVMQDRNSHFLKYYKNVQGTQFTLQNKVGNWDMQSSIGAAMSKGKFASNDIQ